MNKQPGFERVSSTKNPEKSEKFEKEHRLEAGRRRTGGAMPVQRAQPIMVPNAVAAMPCVMTGFVTLVPHTVLDAIALTNAVIVVQCLEPLEMFTGFETANRYVVHDMYLRPLLYCHEQSNAILRNVSGNDRNFRMDMRDVFGAPFMSAFRRKPCCGCTDYLSTEFQGGAQLGLMEKGCCDRTFQIYGAGCSQPLIIDSPCCVRCPGGQVFPVMTQTGQYCGQIVRLYPGFLQEAFTDADTFVVSFPPDMPVILKLLLISAVFLIDFTYFEEDE